MNSTYISQNVLYLERPCNDIQKLISMRYVIKNNCRLKFYEFTIYSIIPIWYKRYYLIDIAFDFNVKLLSLNWFLLYFVACEIFLKTCIQIHMSVVLLLRISFSYMIFINIIDIVCVMSWEKYILWGSPYFQSYGCGIELFIQSLFLLYTDALTYFYCFTQKGLTR